MNRIAPLLVIVLFLASCSEPVRESAAVQEGSPFSGGGRDEEAPGTKRAAEKQKSKRDKPQSIGGSIDRSGESAGSGSDGGSARPGRSTSEGRETAATGQREEPSGSSIRPKGGRYEYAQSGWEEFCTATCDRSDLPASQAITLQVARRGDGLELVSVSKSSEDRSVTTTSVLTGNALDIHRVELRYRGFSNTYEPAPPVTSLRFPMQAGDHWEGSWKADTSGDYEAVVVTKESLVVDGRRMQTYKLDTATRFRGDFRGYMDATVWIDPRTTIALRTSGSIRLETNFGRFNSDFDTMLLEGPGY